MGASGSIASPSSSSVTAVASAALEAELALPLDASDVDPSLALLEVERLRGLLHRFGSDEPITRIQYMSRMEPEFCNAETLDEIVEKSKVKNKRLGIGGHLEVNFNIKSGGEMNIKLVSQTIYGRKSQIHRLYSQIKSDPRHVIETEFFDELPWTCEGGGEASVEYQNKMNGGWGMVWRNRERQRRAFQDNSKEIAIAVGSEK